MMMIGKIRRMPASLMSCVELGPFFREAHHTMKLKDLILNFNWFGRRLVRRMRKHMVAKKLYIERFNKIWEMSAMDIINLNTGFSFIWTNRKDFEEYRTKIASVFFNDEVLQKLAKRYPNQPATTTKVFLTENSLQPKKAYTFDMDTFRRVHRSKEFHTFVEMLQLRRYNNYQKIPEAMPMIKVLKSNKKELLAAYKLKKKAEKEEIEANKKKKKKFKRLKFGKNDDQKSKSANKFDKSVSKGNTSTTKKKVKGKRQKTIEVTEGKSGNSSNSYSGDDHLSSISDMRKQKRSVFRADSFKIVPVTIEEEGNNDLPKEGGFERLSRPLLLKQLSHYPNSKISSSTNLLQPKQLNLSPCLKLPQKRFGLQTEDSKDCPSPLNSIKPDTPVSPTRKYTLQRTKSTSKADLLTIKSSSTNLNPNASRRKPRPSPYTIPTPNLSTLNLLHPLPIPNPSNDTHPAIHKDTITCTLDRRDMREVIYFAYEYGYKDD